MENVTGGNGLATGVLIGGVLGIAVGALVALLARIFLGVLRRLVKKDSKSFDPRWLLQ